MKPEKVDQIFRAHRDAIDRPPVGFEWDRERAWNRISIKRNRKKKPAVWLMIASALLIFLSGGLIFHFLPIEFGTLPNHDLAIEKPAKPTKNNYTPLVSEKQTNKKPLKQELDKTLSTHNKVERNENEIIKRPVGKAAIKELWMVAKINPLKEQIPEVPIAPTINIKLDKPAKPMINIRIVKAVPRPDENPKIKIVLGTKNEQDVIAGNKQNYKSGTSLNFTFPWSIQQKEPQTENGNDFKLGFTKSL